MTMRRVAFYTRISLDEDKQKYSLEAQKDRLAAFCKGQFGDEWILSHVYRDCASGTTLDRPELQQMLADAQTGQFDLLVAFRVDRLSRRVAELSHLAQELKGYGVDLKSATEPIDTSTPAGMMIFQTLGVFAEFEQKSIVERTKVGMRKKAQTGKWPGGRVPLGYTFHPDTGLQIHQDESVIVRKIFDLYINGKEGSSAIAQTLNREGYRTKQGRKFNRKGILVILRNPFYVGRFRWQKEEFESEHEAILSEETFQAAQAILQERSAESPGYRLSNQNQRLLSGLLRCSRCHSPMIGVSANVRGNKVAYYACRRRLDTKECDQDYVRADLIEEEILAQVQAVFQDEALLEEIWESAQKKLAGNGPAIDEEVKSIDDKLARGQDTLNKYFRAFEDGSMNPVACSQRIEDLSTQHQALQDRRRALLEQRANLDLPALKTDFLGEILGNLRGVVAAVPIPQKKHLLRLLVEKVLVSDRCTFEVWFRLPHFGGVRTLEPLVAPRGLEPLFPP